MTAFAFSHPHPAGLPPIQTRPELAVTRPPFAEPVARMARRSDPRDAQVHAALDVPRLTITRMADVLGVPRATLEAYRLGTRRMPAPVRARLVAFLRQHGEVMQQLADALAGEPPAAP